MIARNVSDTAAKLQRSMDRLTKLKTEYLRAMDDLGEMRLKVFGHYVLQVVLSALRYRCHFATGDDHNCAVGARPDEVE